MEFVADPCPPNFGSAAGPTRVARRASTNPADANVYSVLIQKWFVPGSISHLRTPAGSILASFLRKLPRFSSVGASFFHLFPQVAADKNLPQACLRMCRAECWPAMCINKK